MIDNKLKSLNEIHVNVYIKKIINKKALHRNKRNTILWVLYSNELVPNIIIKVGTLY